MGPLCFWGILYILLVGAYSLPQSIQLRVKPDGHFKILQIADMHYANGASTKCKDVLSKEYGSCSDLNTTAFIERLIAAEKPDLIVFSGDNIFGQDTSDPRGSMNAAFAPAVKAGIPWAAILGNHDQESSISRFQVMEHIASMEHTLSQVYPSTKSIIANAEDVDNMTEVDGFGNYHLSVRGAMGSPLENRSVLNLYLLDSGDYSKHPKVHGYGWIQESQKKWFKELSSQLKDDFYKEPIAHNFTTPPALVYFHIPLVEARHVKCSITGSKQESIGCAQVNSGFLQTMREAGNPHIVFNGHDHVNDFCGDLSENVKMCYGGGVGYHAYGKAGWSRRARVVDVSLHKNRSSETVGGRNNAPMRTMSKASTMQHTEWREVDQIVTWKRLDDQTPTSLPTIDYEVLWSRLPLPSKSHYEGWSWMSVMAMIEEQPPLQSSTHTHTHDTVPDSQVCNELVS
ncbi:hypothetical protein GOP47_0011514 [Adiantum capillus-veneris]|uniref:Calcineurin-like phosphoesterase domain-containing protein n=1 Tax=Adiantum capillus-veneris TaxID=13818 RepID=A0A9D4UTF7_ADICA|nr:hypothetical protein GOP47_0011514 [Adiantum capillus-veneris]